MEQRLIELAERITKAARERAIDEAYLKANPPKVVDRFAVAPHAYIETKIPLHGMPEAPELFRPVEHPLGLCPFALTQPALAVLGGFSVQTGWAFG